MLLYNIDFSIAGLVLLTLLYIYLKLLFKNTGNTINSLRLLVLVLLLTDFMDIVTSYSFSYPDIVPVWLNYILATIFFMGEVFSTVVFLVYIRFLIDPEKGERNRVDKINVVLLGLYGLICLTTSLTHWMFWFDDAGRFCKGPAYYGIFIIPIYLFMLSLFRLLKHKDRFSRRKLLTIFSFVILAAFAPLAQLLWAGKTLIIYFIFGVAAFIVVAGMETPDYIKLQETLEELEEHKELLEKAKEWEEERNRAVHAMTRSASWSLKLDKDFNYIDAYWSDEFYWLLGYEREELGEKQYTLWNDSLHPDESARITEAFTKGMTGQAEYKEVYRLRDSKGEYRWYVGTGELKTDENNNYVFHGIIRDANEEKIKEDLIKEKTIALDELTKSQKELELALEKAESADRAKSDFLANMSHEIRTPINAVLGMNELIGRESSEPAIQNYSANVADAGNALLSLVNDILDFSKIEAGKMELAPSDYELSSLIREIDNMIGVRCTGKGLELKIHNNPQIPNNLYGDEVRIRQIIINFMTNAVKYTDTGSVTLDVDFEKKSDDRIVLVIKTIDTGIGIKPENIPLMFESFKRIDMANNRKREGTGLGLNITRSFIEMMGGTIDVESEYGKGSVFTARIPQTVKGTQAIGEYASANASGRKNKYEAMFTAPEAKILVVDDVAINLKVIKGLLKQTGIIIDTAQSGQECLKAIADTSYDVILLDHMMPEMDGIETLEHINADKSHMNQDTPIIMLTANAILGVKEEYLSMGFVDYLSKPVRAEDLETTLMKYIPQDKIIQR